MEKKVKLSNRFNRLGCGKELLYCTRVYVNSRLYPTGWREVEYLLNIFFRLVRGEKNHVRASYLYELRTERRNHACSQETKIQAHQEPDEETAQPPTQNETGKNEGKT